MCRGRGRIFAYRRHADCLPLVEVCAGHVPSYLNTCSRLPVVFNMKADGGSHHGLGHIMSIGQEVQILLWFITFRGVGGDDAVYSLSGL